jgi:hypothetical protein
MVPEFELAKTFYALDPTVTVIGHRLFLKCFGLFIFCPLSAGKQDTIGVQHMTLPK